MPTYPGVKHSQFTDLNLATLSNHVTKWDNIRNMMARQNYHNLNMLMDQVELESHGVGKNLEFQFNVPGARENKQDSYFNEYDERQTQNTDTLRDAIVPWSNVYYPVQYAEGELIINGANADEAYVQITNVIDARRASAFLPFADGIEGDLMCLPNTSADKIELYGLSYMFVPITAAQYAVSKDPQFQGANPYGNSDYYGLDRSTTANARLRNLNAGWENSTATITEADRNRMSTIMRKLHFSNPPMMTAGSAQPVNDYIIMGGDYMLNQLATAARSQNDTLGNDITVMANDVYVNKMRVQYNETLNDSVRAQDAGYTAPAFGKYPLVFLNKNHLKCIGWKERFFKHREPKSPTMQPTAIVEFVDTSFQMVPLDPQKVGAVISLDVA
jgi:hypothetical protein